MSVFQDMEEDWFTLVPEAARNIKQNKSKNTIIKDDSEMKGINVNFQTEAIFSLLSAEMFPVIRFLRTISGETS